MFHKSKLYKKAHISKYDFKKLRLDRLDDGPPYTQILPCSSVPLFVFDNCLGQRRAHPLGVMQRAQRQTMRSASWQTEMKWCSVG